VTPLTAEPVRPRIVPLVGLRPSGARGDVRLGDPVAVTR
jgi:hypothetical protein